MGAPWKFDLYIDGKWTSGEGSGVLDVIDPATEESIGEVPEATVGDARRAIEAARRAFDEGPWPWMKPRERRGRPGEDGRGARAPVGGAPRARGRPDRLGRLYH